MKLALGLLIPAVMLSGCPDSEKGGYCFTGQCALADGGSTVFREVCSPYLCFLPEDAPGAGIEACQRYGGDDPNSRCAAPPVGCSAHYAARRDWEDCYHPN